MMKKLLLMLVIMLSGCSTIKDYLPSRWDANQSRVATNIQQLTRHLDCTSDINIQARLLSLQVEWLDIYSKTKDTRDVVKVVALMDRTVKDLVTKSEDGLASPAYCEIKKKILVQQADMVAHMIQGRF